MLFFSTILLTFVLTALSYAAHDEQLAIAGLLFLSDTPPSTQDSDKLITLPSREDSQALKERAIRTSFGWYSRFFNFKDSRQWIFGNATSQFNITVSRCITHVDVVGVYQFMNGTISTNATAGDIYTDLGYGTALANREKMLAHALINAQAAYDEISTFLLDSILCSDSSPVRDELRRQLLFESEGRVTTVILQAATGTVIYFVWNGIGLAFDNAGVKMAFGGVATFSLLTVVGILQIFQQEGRIEPYESAFMASVWVARVRRLIRKMRQSGRANQAAGPCLPATQMAAAAAYAGSGAAPDQALGIAASADVPEFQATCANES